ncbi:MAG: helix-turn-helix domain-containing protein [Deltaproteobacteria bacterium]|jgi:predicted transcriptional regulator|nr:helix-turn-helix domain-containing protein [Deltaproteobacteria bacterium]MBW2532447.1 helix-turn-helix domain-containing protein [Deltaproteobacteria bacterium]
MARRTRNQLAAVLGAAVLSATAPAEATLSAANSAPAAADTQAAAASEQSADILREVIESKLQTAHDAHRYGEIEQLGTLWMTLKQRDQLGRQVSSGERFVAAALRNQRVTSYRQAARLGRFVPTGEPLLANLAEQQGFVWQMPTGARAPDERLAAVELLDQLEEPYRTAVVLSAEGLNRREVAERMGVSHAAVRKWMQRLRERFDLPTA